MTAGHENKIATRAFKAALDRAPVAAVPSANSHELSVEDLDAVSGGQGCNSDCQGMYVSIGGITVYL